MSGKQKTILIIDDEPQIRRFLRTTLSAHQYLVIEASDGKTGTENAALEKPDLIILDLGLPDMNGSDVLQKIREWSETPIIILSARDDERQIASLLDHGADDYIVKPFGAFELLARIRVALRHHFTQKGETSKLTFNNLEIDLSPHVF